MEFTRLSGVLPIELESIIREYSHPIHRKPEHGIMMKNLFDIMKKPIIKKIHNLINNDSQIKCNPEFLCNMELGCLFNNPLEYTQYAEGSYNLYIKRYNHKILDDLLRLTKKKFTKSYHKMKNKPYNKNCSVKCIAKINIIMKKCDENLKFYNNINSVTDRMLELYNNLLSGLVNNDLTNLERSDVGREIDRLAKIHHKLKLKNAKTKKEKRDIKREYLELERIIRMQYPYEIPSYMYCLYSDDNTRMYMRNINICKNEKTMKRTNFKRYKFNNQKRNCYR